MADYYRNQRDRTERSLKNGSNRNAAPASTIGESFHNPYTFIPFPDRVERHLPTAITADELSFERHRKSGILELEVTTLSPLMTCNPVPVSEKAIHKTYPALTIGNDVIVPSTGIRGALRTLMTIISGGTLGYMDEELWLTQGRDAKLGPSTKMPNVPDNAFLAEVIKPGNETSPGLIRLGTTILKRAKELAIKNLDDKRTNIEKRKDLIYKDNSGEKWKVKLSGPPLPEMRKNKKEGLFKANGLLLELSEQFWTIYRGRHRHSVKETLEKGDLIWLEPMQKDCTRINCEADIKSIQWARWGREGVALKEKIPLAVLPDSMRSDGGVDMVTDLFGQIPHKNTTTAAGPFAARIRPGNLIFLDAKNQTFKETLAPLAPPHPGCLAFYRDGDDLDLIDKHSPLKGYKVYRNTRERGDKAPWKYSVQGVYREKGELKEPRQKVNKTAELLNEGVAGKLCISFRALDPDELALLYAACSVDWKLGGGKPLGLGHCRVTSIKQIDENGKVTVPMVRSANGENLQLTESDAKRIADFKKRITLYKASQVPMDKLRYPRAVEKNRNKSTRAGFSWFGRHATPKKNGKGLETIWTAGELQKKVRNTQIKAQPLPPLNPDDPSADLLYGYDMVELDVSTPKRNQRMVGRMEKFQTNIHASPDEKSGENISLDREKRKAVRAERAPQSTDDRT